MRAPSTVSASELVIFAYAAFSRRYPSLARRRYHRVLRASTGTIASNGTSTQTPTSRVAVTVNITVTNATIVSGTANRTVRDSASTSREVRDSRSPVPARSTVPIGSASALSTNSSRNSASTCSPSANDRYRAQRVSSVCTMMKTAITRITWLTLAAVVPCWTSSTSPPISRGAASPETAARACSPIVMISARGCRRASRRA